MGLTGSKAIVKTMVNDLALNAIRVLRHPLASDGGVLAASRYIAAGLNFFTTAIAARLLGPTDYGVAALAIAYPALVCSFVSVKSSSITVRYISRFRALGHEEKIGSICKLSYVLDFALAVVGMLLVLATSCWVTRFVYEMPHLFLLMVAYAASFPFHSLIGTSYAIFSSWKQFRWVARLEVFGAAIAFLVVTGLLWGDLGVMGFVLGTALGHAVTGLVAMGVAFYVLSRNGIGYWWRTPLNRVAPLKAELANFWGWNYLMVTLSGLMIQVPLILIGRLCGLGEAGFYRLALSLTVAGSHLETSLGHVVYPSLSERWAAGERESLRHSLWRWTLRGGVPLGALLLLTIPFLPIVIPILFGSAYSPMAPGVQVMMAGASVSAAFFWLISFYYASGNIAFWTKAYGLYTAVVIGLGVLFMEQWGFFGLAVLVALSKAVFSISVGLFAFERVR
jgi:O-antigen/teichoic acid export membrane protein